MAKVPVEIIVRALDKTAPALASMAKRMTALKANVNKLNPFGGISKAIGGSAFGQAARRFGRALGFNAIQGGITKVQDRFKAFGKTLPEFGKKFAGHARTAALALVGVATAGAAIGFGLLTSAAESGAALQRMAKQSGVSADFFASTQFAAEQAGVGGEVFSKAMVKLSKQMGEMTVGKGGPLLAFLNEVSPSFARQMKGAKTTESAMMLLGDAFASLEDPQRRATFAAKVFGDEAVQMGEFLHQGNQSIEQRKKLFMRLAGSQEQYASNSADFERALGLTTLAATGLRNAAATHLLPMFTTLANTLANFLANNREGIAAWAKKAADAFTRWADSGGMERLIAGITQVGKAALKLAERGGAAFQKWAESGGLERLGEGISTLAGAAATLAEHLGPTGTAIAAVAAISPNTTLALLALGAQVVGLSGSFFGLGVSVAGAMLPLWPFIAAGVGLALLGKKLYDNWDAITAKFEEFGDTMRWAVVDTWKQVRPMLAAMSKIPGLGFAPGALLAVGDEANRETEAAIEARTGQSVASINARALRAGQRMGATTSEQMTPQAAAAAVSSSSQSETRVEVNFSNLPRGARVSTQSNADAVDISRGYSSLVPDA